MPAKRTRRLRPARRLPETIERLVADLPIEETEEARERLIEAAFFGDYPGIPQSARQRALDILSQWRRQ